MQKFKAAAATALGILSSAAWLKRASALALVALPLQAAAVDLLVSNLTDTPDPAIRGGTILYSASVTNNTADTAHNAVVEFALDPNTSFVSVSDAACSYAAGPHKVSCSYATINGDINGPGSADVRNIGVTVRSLAGAAATVSLTATVSTSDPDGNAGNNTLSQLTTLDNGADVSIVLTGAPASVVASGNLVYTAAISNAGPNPAGATTATVTLTPNVSFQSASGTGWACNAAGQLVSCTRAAAAVGALPSITVNTRVTGAVTGTVTSSAAIAIDAGVTDFNNANNTSVANNTITNGTDLSVTKVASSAIMGSGQPVSFTLRPRKTVPSPPAMSKSLTACRPALPASAPPAPAGPATWWGRG